MGFRVESRGFGPKVSCSGFPVCVHDFRPLAPPELCKLSTTLQETLTLKSYTSSVCLVVEPSNQDYIPHMNYHTPKGGYNPTLHWVP